MVQGMPDDALKNMRQYSEQCRQLAGITHDEELKWRLPEWVHEIEADIKRSELKQAEQQGA